MIVFTLFILARRLLLVVATSSFLTLHFAGDTKWGLTMESVLIDSGVRTRDSDGERHFAKF